MKLYTAAIAAASFSVAHATLNPEYHSYCNKDTFDDSLCQRECDHKVIGQTITREWFGNNFFYYNVYGTESVNSDKAKASYRNVIQMEEGGKCKAGTLALLRQSLMEDSMQLDILDGSNKMMSIEHVFSNMDQTLTDGEYDGCAKGLWIQTKKDHFNRNGEDCMKNGQSGKKKDCYYLMLSDLAGRLRDATATEMEEVNDCIESATVFQIKQDNYESEADFTKHMAHAACSLPIGSTWIDDTIDDPIDDPIDPISTPTPPCGGWRCTAPPPPTDCESDGPLGTCCDERCQPDPNLPDYNNLDYEFSCDDGDWNDKEEPSGNYNWKSCSLVVPSKGWTFKGRIDKGTEVVTFLPIPYAEDPSGSNRWKSPKLKNDYPEGASIGTHDQSAAESFPICWQDKKYGDDRVKTEDCLYLSIEVSKSAIEKKMRDKSVAIWIHGGSWKTGSGLSPTGNHRSSCMNQDIIWVSVNYRLDVLGYLPLEEDGEELLQGNWGYQDQIAAMKWVHSFIGLFGGDKNQVTATGWSAGGGAIWWHVANPGSWPYFHRAAPMGSHMNWHDTYDSAEEVRQVLWTNLAKLGDKGCAKNDVECLRTLEIKNSDKTGVYDQCKKQCWDRLPPLHNGSPENVWDSFANGNTRPNTPLIYTIACNEIKSVIKSDIMTNKNDFGFLKPFSTEEKAEIKAAYENNPDVNQALKSPSPYFSTYLERFYGPFGDEMKEAFGCKEEVDCIVEPNNYSTSKRFICPTLYAMRNSPFYGDQHADGKPTSNFYAVDFCQRKRDDPKYKNSCSKDLGALNDNPGFACHGVETGPAKGGQMNDNDDPWGHAVGEAYGAFFRDGVIPKGHDWSLNTYEDSGYGEMHFMKEHKPDDGAPGVALPFIENNDNATIKRAAGCAVLDKIHDEKGIYAQKAAVAWGDWEDWHNEA